MPRVDARFPHLRQLHERQNASALRSVFEAQREDVELRSRLLDDWDARLADVLFDRNLAAATDAGRLVARRLSREFRPAIMTNWLTRNAEIGAERINNATRGRLAEADAVQARAAAEIGEVVGVAAVFQDLISTQVDMYAVSMATMAINFGAKEGAQQSGAGMKMWQTNSGAPRSSHSAMAGQTVPIGELFSNGMDWPGDMEGGASEVANCQCSLVFL